VSLSLLLVTFLGVRAGDVPFGLFLLGVSVLLVLCIEFNNKVNYLTSDPTQYFMYSSDFPSICYIYSRRGE